MHLTKIAVFVAHEQDLDVEELMTHIEFAVGQQIEESRKNVFYEVRHYDTKVVTLGSIDLSLQEGYPLQEATESKEKDPVTA
jgi:hypothetical protein